MPPFYFAESFRIYNSMSISLLTISIAMASLLIPYLKIWIDNVFKDRIALERLKRRLTAKQIAENYNSFKEEVGNINNLVFVLFINMLISLVILVLTTLALNVSSYNCFNIPNCQNPSPPIWSIDQQIPIPIFGIKIEQIANWMIYLTAANLLLLTYIIFRLYKIIDKVLLQRVKE